jgi:hypothetical protein
MWHCHTITSTGVCRPNLFTLFKWQDRIFTLAFAHRTTSDQLRWRHRLRYGRLISFIVYDGDPAILEWLSTFVLTWHTRQIYPT